MTKLEKLKAARDAAAAAARETADAYAAADYAFETARDAYEAELKKQEEKQNG